MSDTLRGGVVAHVPRALASPCCAAPALLVSFFSRWDFGFMGTPPSVASFPGVRGSTIKHQDHLKARTCIRGTIFPVPLPRSDAHQALTALNSIGAKRNEAQSAAIAVSLEE